jgi:putative transposase
MGSAAIGCLSHGWNQPNAACSMSRAGDGCDNAVAESFLASLKKECSSRVHFATRTEAFDAIQAYIDGFYNPVRRHSALGYLSPIDFEKRAPRGSNGRVTG